MDEPQTVGIKMAYPNLTTILCDAQGLMDIAPQGRARQSSTSRWSKPNDAQRAVAPSVFADFAFHTDFEESPWWELTFDRAQSVEVIVISNRRRVEFQDLARSLRVEISSDGKNWQVLHSGDLSFGAEAEGIPLILPVGADRPFSHLRLSLESSGYLHLSGVRLLGRQNDCRRSRPTVIFATRRADGFGERLKGLVNAMALAEFFGARFAFEWPEFSEYNAVHHAVDSPEEVFSADFLQANHGIPSPTIELTDFLKEDASGTDVVNTSVLVPHNSLSAVDSALASQLKTEAFAEAFERIGFSEQLTRAVEAARALDLAEGTVGLHLRAGDIVYGRYRFNRRYTNKVVPYPISAAFVSAERAAGRDVLLFGQDAELCRQIAQTTGAISAEALHVEYGFNKTQAAIFDIVAMSRCVRVVSGQSGFSQLAQRIGGFKMVDPRDLMPGSAAAEVLCAALLDPKTDSGVVQRLSPSEKQVAFAAWYAVYFYAEHIARPRQIDLLNLALRNDPDNAFYGIVLAVRLFEAGRASEAEAELWRLLGDTAPKERFGSLTEIVRTRHPDATLALSFVRAPLEKMAQRGIAPAAILAVALARQLKEDRRAADMTKLGGPDGARLIDRLAGKPLL